MQCLRKIFDNLWVVSRLFAFDEWKDIVRFLEFHGKETLPHELETEDSLIEDLNRLFQLTEGFECRASDEAVVSQYPSKDIPQHLKPIIEMCKISLV